jgi:hypothetical protein
MDGGIAMSRSAARLVTAVALLVGLLGMHGLSSHDAMTGPPASTIAAAPLPMGQEHTPAGAAAMQVQGVATATPVLQGVALAMSHRLCLAALLGSTVLLVLALLRCGRPRSPAAQELPRIPPLTWQLRRPPDLAGLCVSLT